MWLRCSKLVINETSARYYLGTMAETASVQYWNFKHIYIILFSKCIYVITNHAKKMHQLMKNEFDIIQNKNKAHIFWVIKTSNL